MNLGPFEPVNIYVYLEDEGTDVWRPVLAIPLGNDCYKILSEHEDPEDEHWQFLTGETVRCCMKELYEGPALVAIEKV